MRGEDGELPAPELAAEPEPVRRPSPALRPTGIIPLIFSVRSRGQEVTRNRKKKELVALLQELDAAKKA